MTTTGVIHTPGTTVYPIVHLSILCSHSLAVHTLHIVIEPTICTGPRCYSSIQYLTHRDCFTYLCFHLQTDQSPDLQESIVVPHERTILQVAFNETLDHACWAEGILLQNGLIVDDKGVGLDENFAWQFLLQNNIPDLTFPTRNRLG